MADFLQSAEQGACKQALYAVRDTALALDIVQEAMLQLVDRYAHAPAQELPLLFQHILHHRMHRRCQQLRWRQLPASLLAALRPTRTEDDAADPLETLEIKASAADSDPQQWYARPEVAQLIDGALLLLPTPQRQAFLLRHREKLTPEQVARVMACTPGRVKAHTARASQTLAAILQQKGVPASLSSGEDKLALGVCTVLEQPASQPDSTELQAQREKLLQRFEQRRNAPLRRSEQLALWQQRHLLVLRHAMLALSLVLISGGAVWLATGAQDEEAVDAAILSQPLPLELLMEPHFSGSVHD